MRPRAIIFVALLAIAMPSVVFARPAKSATYFDAGPFARAQALMSRGRTKQAIELLRKLTMEQAGDVARPQALYLLGLCLMQEEIYDEAERVFAQLVDLYPELEEEHRYSRGQALFRWGNYLDAAQVLAVVDPDGPRGEEARLLRARALYRATDFSELRRYLEEALDREGRLDAELMYLLGQARYRMHDAFGAYRAFQEVWREAPDEPHAGAALAQIAELRIGERTLISREERAAITRLESLIMAKDRLGEALASLENLLERQGRGKGLRPQIAYARGRLAERRGRHGEALRHYERALRLAPAPQTELRARAALRQARALERLGQIKRALAVYELVAERFGDRPETEEALFSAGEIHLSRRDYAGAEQSFRGLLLKNPVTRYRARCLWALAWVKYRLGRYEEAGQFFGSLERMHLPSDLDAAARYWRAKTEASLGQLDRARERLMMVIREHPLSYYAALAEDQLAEALVIEDDARAGPAASKGRKDPLLVRAEEFLRLGLPKKASEAIRRFEHESRRGQRRLEESELRSLASLYDRLGKNMDARKAREEYAREYPHAMSAAELVEAARRAHPIRFDEEIRKASAEFDISESLMFALVRTESGFRAEAVSPMKAYGLAQLILPTARQVSRSLGAGAVSPQRLLRNPAFNVRLGAAYLRELLDHFEGSEPLALAAYNAGPTAVDSWMAYRVRKLAGVGAAGRGVGLAPRPDELVEEIPVFETRTYVKAVLARARSYARLYPTLELEAPTVVSTSAAEIPSEVRGADSEPDRPFLASSTTLERPFPRARALGVLGGHLDQGLGPGNPERLDF